MPLMTGADDAAGAAAMAERLAPRMRALLTMLSAAALTGMVMG